MADHHFVTWWCRKQSSASSVLALGCFGVGLVAMSAFGRPVPLIIYNASVSAPAGFYRVLPEDSISRGDLVLVKTPNSVRLLAARRGYLPEGVPLVKRTAALEGDTVCICGHAVIIDGMHVADRLDADGQGRPLPAWSGCRTLQSGEIFLLMEGVQDSFDGRYFGPISINAIVGKLVRLRGG